MLKVGTPKTWDDSKKDLGYIRKAGVRQFVSTYNRVKDLKGDDLLWGDEIEYGVFKMDSSAKKVRLSLRAKEIMDELNRKENEHSQVVEGCNWVPEYGAWMVEATPNRPYTGYTTDLLRLERNMRLRRKRILTVLDDDEIAPTVTAYPMLGAQGDDGSVPPTKVGGPRTLSEYIGDGIINPHPRFGTLTANIRQRRGSKVNIQVPLFRDANTPEYSSFGPPPAGSVDGCCGSDSFQLWRYGKGDACFEQYGKGYVAVGCSKSSADEQCDGDRAVEVGQALQKWLVDVKCPGCKGLFYRRAPNEIVPDADWPRNGDIVVGYELQDPQGWIRLQNGYYLPMHSDNGKIQFLHKITSRAQPSNAEMKRVGSNTPLFRTGEEATKDLTSLLAEGGGGGGCTILAGAGTETETETTTTTATATATTTAAKPQSDEAVRAAIHMDAMAFGMGCCCLQITFQAKDMDESRCVARLRYWADPLTDEATFSMKSSTSRPDRASNLYLTRAQILLTSHQVHLRPAGGDGPHHDGANCGNPGIEGKARRHGLPMGDHQRERRRPYARGARSRGP